MKIPLFGFRFEEEIYVIDDHEVEEKEDVAEQTASHTYYQCRRCGQQEGSVRDFQGSDCHDCDCDYCDV